MNNGGPIGPTVTTVDGSGIEGNGEGIIGWNGGNVFSATGVIIRLRFQGLVQTVLGHRGATQCILGSQIGKVSFPPKLVHIRFRLMHTAQLKELLWLQIRRQKKSI